MKRLWLVDDIGLWRAQGLGSESSCRGMMEVSSRLDLYVTDGVLVRGVCPALGMAPSGQRGRRDAISGGESPMYTSMNESLVSRRVEAGLGLKLWNEEGKIRCLESLPCTILIGS